MQRCLYDKVDKEMSNIVDLLEDWIQSAFLNALDNIVALKTELEIGSIDASSRRYVTSVTANSHREEC